MYRVACTLHTTTLYVRVCMCSRVCVSVTCSAALRGCCALSVQTSFYGRATSSACSQEVSMLHNGREHALFPSVCSRLENRDPSRSGIAHCVRWVARLYQQPSLSCHRWVMTSQVLAGLPETFTILPHWISQVDWAPDAFTILPHWIGQVDWTLKICQKTSTSFSSEVSQLDFAQVSGSFRDSLPESLTPPFFGPLGSDFNRLCHRPTHISPTT